MVKQFFEAFPTLKLNKETKEALEPAVVERISATQKRDFYRIYLSSDRLIEKEYILDAEEEIKKQLFPLQAVVIKIYEKFSLSSQYTLQKFMHIYKESILL